MRFNFLFVIFAALLASCASSRSAVSDGADLSQYKYILVVNAMPPHHALQPQVMEQEVELYNALEATGLQFVSDMKLMEMTQQQKAQVLLAKYAVDSRPERAVVTVNLEGFYTGRPIVSCTAEYAKTLTQQGDLRGAFRKLGEQLYKIFH